MFQKLRKTSISRRFSIGITAVVVLLLVTTAIRVIYPIHIYTTIGSEIREREEKIALISAVGDHIDAIVTSILMLHLVSSEERTHFLDTIKQDADRIEGNFAFLKAIVRTQKGTHLLTELVDLYHDRATGIAFFVDAEKNASTTYVLPIHDIIHLSARYHAQVQQFVEYQQHAEYNIQRLAENTMYLTIFYEIIVNLLVAILLGFVAWWIIPNINKPIRKISQFVETISHGKVPEPMVGEWAGEFEDIRKHINNMSEAINALFTLDHYALQVGTRNPVANLELALQNHLDWKMQFATAVHNKTQIDEALASSEDQCYFWKLLLGELKIKHSILPSYPLCVAKHAEFHRHAGEIARLVNEKKYAEAETALEHGPYVETSSVLRDAVASMKQEAGF